MKKEFRNFDRYMLLLIFVILLALSIYIALSLFSGLVWGLVIGFAFLPVDRLIREKLKNRTLSATITTTTVFILVLVPLIFFMERVITGFIRLYRNLDLENLINNHSGAFTTILPYIKGIIENILGFLVNAVSGVIISLPGMVLNLFVAILVAYYVFKESDLLLSKVKKHLPMKDEVVNTFFRRTKEIVYGTIYGMIAIGILLSIFSYIAFIIFDVPSPWFFAFLVLIVGIMPVIGSALVTVPLSIYLVYIGEYFNGIGLFIYSMVVLTFLIDTLLKNHMISKKIKIHPAISFIGIFGGISVFGLTGVILGPLVLSFLFLILDIYFSNKAGGKSEVKG